MCGSGRCRALPLGWQRRAGLIEEVRTGDFGSGGQELPVVTAGGCQLMMGRAKEPGSRQAMSARGIGAVIFGLEVLLGACDDRKKYQTPTAPEGGVAKPELRPVTLYLEFTGNTSAYNRVELVARVQGFLDKVGYKDGDRVAAGTTLFEIERAPFETSLQIA